MRREFRMGNEAIALGAVAAGVNLVSGYPGTPSTEVLETVAKCRPKDCYVEWSVNEKTAMEVAAGAAYSGARVMVTMKQVGLNVASDPLMSLEYIGVKGGMVILVADDPGPISSQTEQDTRTFAMYSKIPVFDPSSAQEAYEMVQEAFDISERYHTPVFLRPTTRVCHAYASISVKDESEYKKNRPEGFVKDSKRWVIFPKLAFENHKKIEERNDMLSGVFSKYAANQVIKHSNANGAEGQKNANCYGKVGIAAGGISYTYVMEAIAGHVPDAPEVLKIATPFPFPEELAFDFLKGKDAVLCVEELDPVIERALIFVAGKYQLPVKIYGKLTGHVVRSGENTIDGVKRSLQMFLCEQGISVEEAVTDETCELTEPPALAIRPPVLCAGCPHRASFYDVKCAMKGKKTIFCGDIGCYTLGNAMPLDMVDTCLCMGAGLGIAQGVNHIEPDTSCFAFVGDSTFFASAIPGVVNAVYNQADMTLVVLDNSTTAMTGHQPHPGTGHTMMGEIVSKIDMVSILKGIGLETVETIDPFEHEAAVQMVARVAAKPGVKAIIFKSPCIAIVKSDKRMQVNRDKCIGCQKCIREIGCPALYKTSMQDTKAGKNGRDTVTIDESQCTGCTLCSQLCPVHAIEHKNPADSLQKGGMSL